jgi:single-strand DNA-binding protein
MATSGYLDLATRGDFFMATDTWYTVITWGTLAEHAAETLTKGARVIVHGRLAERSYETKDGEARTVWELTADEIGTTLRHSTERGGASGTWSEKASVNTDRDRPQGRLSGDRYARAAGKN